MAIKSKFYGEGLTFDDVLLMPAYSEVLPREVSIVTPRNFVKRRMIDALKTEILEFVPKRMRSKKKRDVMELK